jgi:hypothetical protein
MKEHNLDKNWMQLYYSARSNPLNVFSDILLQAREKCWYTSWSLGYHIYEAEERLELRSVVLTDKAVHSYLFHICAHLK